MDYVDRQDVFDSQMALPSVGVLMLLDFNDLWDKHRKDIELKGFTDEYFSDVKTIANKYDVEFTEPKFQTRFLKLVDGEHQPVTH